MEVFKLFDYVEEGRNDTGIDIVFVYRETKTEEVENDFIPDSFENISSKMERVATYVGWYTEFAHLYIEKSGAGADFIVDLLEELKENHVNPYRYDQIAYRPPDTIRIEKIENGYKVIDRSEEIFFSTDSSSNPQELN